MSTRKQKPTTPRSWALYRAQLSCVVGRGSLERKTSPPCDLSPLEYAAFCALHAIEDIATALAEDQQPKGKRP